MKMAPPLTVDDAEGEGDADLAEESHGYRRPVLVLVILGPGNGEDGEERGAAEEEGTRVGEPATLPLRRWGSRGGR